MQGENMVFAEKNQASVQRIERREVWFFQVQRIMDQATMAKN